MPGVPCGRIRAVLSEAGSGHPVANDESWSSLLSHGAVQGSPDSPQVTPVGRHVLAELEVRASRTDSLPLEVVADQLSRVMTDLDQVAKTGEYFLAELGPVTPAEAVPLLRPVAVGLANRRETPEEMAAGFRNMWGSVEVMGGDSRDRLLAAELLNASDAPMDRLYAPMMMTTNKIREKFGEKAPAVAPAALLHLHPPESGEAAYDAFVSLRAAGLGSEEAALLAGMGAPDETKQRRERLLSAFTSLGLPETGSRFAASFLMAAGGDPDAMLPRVAELHRLLTGLLPVPMPAAALLSSLTQLEPAEIIDWVRKAVEIVRVRRIAPTAPELAALGVALVYGLPRSEFTDGTPPTRPVQDLSTSAGVLAVHAWVYRPLVASPSAGSRSAPSPAPQ